MPPMLSDADEVRTFLDFVSKFLSRSSSCESDELSKSLLNTLIPLYENILFDIYENNGKGLSKNKLTNHVNVDLFYTMVNLASVGSSYGHVTLFKAVVNWLERIRSIFGDKTFLEELRRRDDIYLINAARLLCEYVTETLSLYRTESDQSATAVIYDSDLSSNEQESELTEDASAQVDDEDSAGEDSEEESLDTKLCTFTLTQKEFMNQHWYHCHTCGMVDGEGVCTVCAKVCHKGHDLSYSKFGSFFCDCGAKGTCQAMAKRSRQKTFDKPVSVSSRAKFSNGSSRLANNEAVVGGSLDSPFQDAPKSKPASSAATRVKQRFPSASSLIAGVAASVSAKGRQTRVAGAPGSLTFFTGSETCRASLFDELSTSKCRVVECLVDVMNRVTPTIGDASRSTTSLGSADKVRAELARLHSSTAPKTFETVDTLASATLGSQDGAFENVKLVLAGENGQTIKHLIMSHVIQRTLMCCLNAFEQRKHFLAVAHDRSKITIMHVSSLLKQAETNQKKLTLTRSCSETMPFPILSLSENPNTDEFLAVCGFKEVHVLTLSSSHSGVVQDRLVLQPPMEGGNYVLKAIWLPNSPTQLAIITADYVRIYDLAESSAQPIFHFMLALGKISDATFLCWERRVKDTVTVERHLMLLSNSGHLYGQQLTDACDYVVHGAFYITNTVELRHPDITENAGVLSQGGASIYYSCKLQMVFLSYGSGKNFCFSFPHWTDTVDRIFPLTWRSALKTSSPGQTPPLFRWTEPAQHPGVVMALTHSTQTPLIFMLTPDHIQIQELIVPNKSKVYDAVPLRYYSSASGERRTNVLLLGEDGSLRVYSVNPQTTDYWQPKPSFVTFPSGVVENLHTTRKKRVSKPDKLEAPPFQVDFFENCSPILDVDYGGSDLLQMYNVQLLKERLCASGSYVACAKANGFQLEVTNNEPNLVTCGVRVELGKRNVERVPTYFEVFGRRHMIDALTRGRWIDFPLTREETVAITAAGGKLKITFGPSRDESGVSFLDSVKLYGKARDAFTWPEDIDELAATSALGGAGVAEEAELPQLTVGGATKPMTSSAAYYGGQSAAPVRREVSLSERMMTSCFGALESYWAVFPPDLTAFRKNSIELANGVLVSTAHSDTMRKAKHVLRQVLPLKSDYYSTKDAYVVAFAVSSLQNLRDPVDPEFYALIVSLLRSVVVNRSAVISNGTLEPLKPKNFVELLVTKFWLTYDSLPLYASIAPVGAPTMFNCEGLVRALVNILHAVCLADVSAIPDVVKAYVSLLFSKHLRIAFACRAALVSLFRKKQQKKRSLFVTTPPRSGGPGRTTTTTLTTTDSGPTSVVSFGGASANVQSANDQHSSAASGANASMPPPGGVGGIMDEDNFELIADQANAEQQMQALLISADDSDDGGHHAHIFDLPAEMDDEQQLVEIAIALSLQEQNADQHGLAGHQHSDHDHDYALVGQHDILDHGHSSDTTASGMSDEEGSNAATEGSTLIISPAEERAPEPPGSVESESAGSGAESVSGRSSTAGEPLGESRGSVVGQMGPGASNVLSLPQSQEVMDSEWNDKQNENQKILLALVDNFTQYFNELDKLKGINCVSFLQVMVTLVSSVNVNDEDDKKIISRMIKSVLQDLRFIETDTSRMTKRSPAAEVDLLRLRLLSVFLSKSKGKSKGVVSDTDIFIASYVAEMLAENGAIDYCLRVLKNIVNTTADSKQVDSAGEKPKVLICHPDLPPPDLSPLFLRPYVKEHAADVFESYTQLITEMALRLPYQIKKVSYMFPSHSPEFSEQWNAVLCDFMRSDQTSYIKKQVRKLLLFICGSKENYRSLRDLHTLRYHSESVQKLCSTFSGYANRNEIDLNRKLIMDYLTLNNMMDHLKSCVEIASSRTSSLQQFCVSSKSDLIYILKLSCVVDDNMAAVLLSLIQLAVGGTENKESKKSRSSTTVSRREDKEKFKYSEKLAYQIVEIFLTEDVLPLLEKSLKYFLLSCNASECRWQMHSIVQSMFEISSASKQRLLLSMLWEKLWQEISMNGRKTAQFVDLLGFYTAKLMSVEEMQQLSFKVLDLLKKQNRLLTDHPNAYLYNSLSSLLEFDGYYLENNPCLVCNNPEVPMTNIKLTSIKADARFTTTSQMFKLVGSHEIAKIVLKISDIRRQKTVKKLKLYYSNKTVPSAVELKTKPELWSLAKTFTLAQVQTELKMEFSVPIVACNLMMEYSEFYETAMAAPETLHCPRCSATVPATPGVCNNCGENVYQCHKCRSINYDEKDPFLCNSCGYSKYAKFDYTVYGRFVASVEPIENEDDRKKTFSHINALLEKADQLYRQLLATRPQIEAALARTVGGQEVGDVIGGVQSNVERASGGVGAAGGISVSTDSAAAAAAVQQIQAAAGGGGGIGGGVGNLVSRNIQILAFKYNRDCRTAFEDLSKIVQKIIANRTELVEFDRRQRSLAGLPPACSVLNTMQSRCNFKDTELMNELIEVALKQGSVRARQAARDLVCGIVKDQQQASLLVCQKIEQKVMKALSENWSPTAMASLVQAELQLLFATLQLTDECWETRLRSVFKLFVQSLNSSPAGTEAVTLPCLNMIQWLLTIPAIGDKNAASLKMSVDARPKINVFAWLNNETSFGSSGFAEFLKTASGSNTAKVYNEDDLRRRYLMEKYANRWLKRSNKSPERCKWLERLLFCLRSAQMRNATATLLEHLCNAQPMRKAVLLDLLTKHLNDLEQLGDRAQEFVGLYQKLIQDEPWKYYLVVRKLLLRLGRMILNNVEKLNEFEGKSLNTRMSQGFSLKILCDLLLSFFLVEPIRKRYKKQLLGTVLHSYLGLKRLLIQRTKLIDDAQSKLLQLLELLTTGNEKETEEFMTICIETAKKYPLDDMRTPLFVFERLCSTIYPEEKEVGDFFINVEKDAAQEDFLQGRMMGNPYNSTDQGMGPLMRDIKNKICRDCDLISLLEDDTGMELLVNGKIISLDLQVSEVYKKIWQPQHSGEPMLIVYRMRGLLGDATEEFIESLDFKKSDKVNEEEIYRLSRVVGRCGGLEVMLERLKCVKNVIQAGTMLPVLLTLFDYCVRVKENRVRLFDSKLGSVATLLSCLTLTLKSSEPDVIALAEKIISIINRLLADTECVSEECFKTFSDKACALDEDFVWLLNQINNNQQVQNSVALKEALMKCVANLILGSQRRMTTLIDYFKNSINFNNYENDASIKATTDLDAFCLIACHIQATKYGDQVKDEFIRNDFVKTATSFLLTRCPPLFKVGLTIDSVDWKEFLARPSLKFILRLLAGLCKNHENTQLLVADECVPIIHRLEQISSEERLGSLAENLMEALKTNPKVAKKIEEVREETKTKKKNLAMAMRQKQLIELGMKISDKGQLRVESTSALKSATDLNEEPGLTCCICREGYKFAPQKLLGIYTFTKRCNADEFELAPRKTPAYSTVSHFNVVHVDCHASAVRSARGRDEWESAMLQNANTKCNGLLPVNGPQVTDGDFANALSKHNAYIQEHTNFPDINFVSTVHDLKLLLLRFAQEKSFSEETGGGGRESNIHIIPYLAGLSYYMLSQTQTYDAQMVKLNAFLSMPPENWVKNSFEVEGPVYYTVLALILSSPKDWDNFKLNFLKRLIVTAQIRNVTTDGKTFNDRNVKNYTVYRPYVLTFGLVDAFYRLVVHEIKVEKSQEWPATVLQFIRANDSKLSDFTSRLLKHFENDLLPCESFAEFCDVSGLLPIIEEDPTQLLTKILETIPLQ